jgi:hypothetical protein
MNRVVVFVVLVSVLLGCAARAATGEFIEMEIEVFRSWGFLGWGSWETLETRFITSRIAPIPAEDAEGLAELRSLCAGDAAEVDKAACALLARLQHISEQSHVLAAELGKKYRVVLRNLTGASLGVVLSIDGLNSNGNEPVLGDESDRKWILLPHQTVRIAGWQISEDEALQFLFAAPSKTHSPLAERHIGQPTVRVPFASAAAGPAETVAFDYSSDSVRLGILCTETDGPGIRIVRVIEGTIAEFKGLRAGDVITYADARPIDSCQDLGDLLATKSSGDRIVVKVHREQRVFLLTLELGN